MTLETERLILRHFVEADADHLYTFACDPEVGTPCGWPAHRSVDETVWVINNVFTSDECYAICLKEDNRAIGVIELKRPGRSDLAKGDDEGELGFWLGKPFWGRGIMPEAANEVLRHAFTDLKLKRVWAGHAVYNDKSRRVQEKCGFVYQYTVKAHRCDLTGEVRDECANLLTRESWLERNDV